MQCIWTWTRGWLCWKREHILILRIETRDAGVGTLKVNLLGVRDASTFKIDIKPVDQRDTHTLQVSYNLRKPGDYLITIKWSEKHIPGSPFRVKIIGDSTTGDESSNGGRTPPAEQGEEEVVVAHTNAMHEQGSWK